MQQHLRARYGLLKRCERGRQYFRRGTPITDVGNPVPDVQLATHLRGAERATRSERSTLPTATFQKHLAK
jgi:hypothetical protein